MGEVAKRRKYDGEPISDWIWKTTCKLQSSLFSYLVRAEVQPVSLRMMEKFRPRGEGVRRSFTCGGEGGGQNIAAHGLYYLNE